MNLNQVTLPALDMAASVAFYRGMGFRQIVDAPHYARFECPEGGATFSVHRVDEAPVNPGVVIYFESDRLDALVEELQREGFAFAQLPRDERWLWREARICDPTGNTICLYHAGENRRNPPWRVSS
ncbi:MAG TPA: VOC family protein [Longimicrobium sp.]|jgi:catechol 2,3-dioxygenase-like lactoylglutathione lyase family enzyme|uniref:VOC family protein n=1 Tax=Longimicrobium sp. TaxID=2029185 RepID=UPI002ED8237E